MEQATQHLNHWAIWAAALATFFLGGIWYGPLFGKKWLAATGLTEEELKKGSPAKIYGLTFVLSLIQSYNLAAFIGQSDFSFSVLAGFLTGAGWVATAIGVIYLFERRSFTHFWVNAGYAVLVFTAMGAIIGAWR